MGSKKSKARASADQVGISVCQACWAGESREVVGRVPLCGLGSRDDTRTRGIDCFDVCEGDSVTVVQPSPKGRRAGGRPVWLRDTHDLAVIDALADWLDAGGPGLVDEPDLVAIHSFTPPRRIRVEHED